jgi:ACS family hexuronate transporter-like MFS transporter
MKLKGMRWWIIVLLFIAAVLNYIDRQTLSALAPTIQADLDMDDQAYANVINIFLIAYTIAYLISGRVAEKLEHALVYFSLWLGGLFSICLLLLLVV